MNALTPLTRLLAAARNGAALALTALAVLAVPATAQEGGTEGAAETVPDQVVLSNGDTLTGTLKSIAGGKVKFESPILGTLSIDLDKVLDLRTGSSVEVVAKDYGPSEQRRITSFADGELVFADGTRTDVDEIEGVNPPAPVKWTVNALLGASFATGNTERRAVNAEANVTRRTRFDRLSGDVQWSYAEEDGNDPADPGYSITQRRISGGGQYDYFISEKLFGLVNTRAVGDELANIELRFSAGAGLGYQWLENDTFNFLTEAGLSYVSEAFSDPVSQDVEYVAGRLRYRLIWNLVTDVLRVDHGLTYLNSLEDTEDFLITKQTNLDLTLTNELFTQFSWELDYDNTPAAGRQETDQRFFLNLGYSF